MAKKQLKRPHMLPQATESAKNTSKTFLWTPGGFQTCALVAQLAQKPSKLLKTAENPDFQLSKVIFSPKNRGFSAFPGSKNTPKTIGNTFGKVLFIPDGQNKQKPKIQKILNSAVPMSACDHEFCHCAPPHSPFKPENNKAS